MQKFALVLKVVILVFCHLLIIIVTLAQNSIFTDIIYGSLHPEPLITGLIQSLSALTSSTAGRTSAFRDLHDRTSSFYGIGCEYTKKHLSFFRFVSGRNSTNPVIWLVPGAGGILSYGPLQRAESIELIYFRECSSGHRQSFVLFSLPKTINQRKFTSIHP